jgi:hypothetical protein
VPSPLARLGRSRLPRATVRAHLQLALETAITGGHLSRMELGALQGLLQGEHVRFPPVAVPRLGHGRRVLLAPMLPSLGPRLGGAFPSQDRLEARQTCDARQVTDDVLELHMHLGQCVVQRLAVPRRIRQQRGPLPSRAPQHANLLLGAATGRQEAVGVQALHPLASMHVTFGPAVTRPRARIDQEPLEATRCEHLAQREPVDTRGFEGHSGEVTSPEPVGQRVEGGGVCTQAADGWRVITGWDSGPVLCGTHIKAGRVALDGGQLGGSGIRHRRCCPLAGSHGSLQKRVVQRRQWVGERRGLQHAPTREQDEACHQCGRRRAPRTTLPTPGTQHQRADGLTHPLSLGSIWYTGLLFLPVVRWRSHVKNFPGTRNCLSPLRGA